MSTTHRPIVNRGLINWLLLVLSLLNVQAWAATPMVTAGNSHSCAVLSSGAVQCWGNNGAGQLGNGSTTNSSIPVSVSGIVNATSVSAGSYHSCAVVSSGAVQCWGHNGTGQLGNGNAPNGSTPSSSIPVTVTGISNATSVSAGGNHTCAVLSSGAVQCWGSNSSSQLGNGMTPDGSRTDSSIPVNVSGISNATSVSAGSSHSCAVLRSGAVQCWGYNNQGQLGNGSTTNSSIPVTVTGVSNATSVSAGDSHTCAVLSGGAVQCWGFNGSGALGNGSTTNSTIPVSVSGVSNATLVSAGGSHTCAVLSSGAVQCWGSNNRGQLGNARTPYDSPPDSRTPISVGSINNATSIAGGSQHTCAVVSSGAVKCWGAGGIGMLGNGLVESLNYNPVSVLGANGQGFLNLGVTVPSSLAADADKVFAWAERTYATIFGPVGQSSQTIPGYRVRAYAGGHYLGVNDSGAVHLYYLGPLNNNAVLDLGLLSGWVAQAGP